MVVAGLAIIYGLPRLTKAVPSPLVAIVLLTVVAVALGLPVNNVAGEGTLPDGLPSFALPDVPLTWETLQIIAPYSLTMAAVGLLESLLTAQIVDDMTHTDSNKRRETGGQGVANIAAACFGGISGCAMIGQSVINVAIGGRGRLSHPRLRPRYIRGMASPVTSRRSSPRRCAPTGLAGNVGPCEPTRPPPMELRCAPLRRTDLRFCQSQCVPDLMAAA